MPDPECAIVGCTNPGSVLMPADEWPDRDTFWLCSDHWTAQSSSLSAKRTAPLRLRPIPPAYGPRSHTLHGDLAVTRTARGIEIEMPPSVADVTLLLNDEQAQRLIGDLVDALVAGVPPEKMQQAP